MTPAYEENLRWLVRLRWGSTAGQAATIAAVHWGLGVRLPLGPLAVLVGVAAASNLGCALWLRRRPEPKEAHLASLLLLDVGLLTALLYYTGGPENPFSFLYLVYLALAAVTLGAAWTWALAALSAACFAALFAWHRPLALGHAGPAGTLSLHVQGMWVAFAVAATFIVYFVQRVTRALADRERALREARERAADGERLAALATLAAGATHELSTPLSTIALVARELERTLEAQGGEAVAEDARLIRREVERCRAVIDQLSVDAGRAPGDSPAPRRVADLVAGALGRPRDASVRVTYRDGAGEAKVATGGRPFAHALRALVDNARYAGGPGSPVEVEVARGEEGYVVVSVRDRGPGMAPEALARARQPFYTTKPAGAGMGLGLFVADGVARAAGGELILESVPGEGTTAALRLPATEG